MLSNEILQILIASEGIRTKAYLDVAGIWTIGIGATTYQDGRKVKQGDKISEADAYELCAWHFNQFKAGVKKVVKSSVNENQLNALTLFAYNFGVGGLRDSTLLRLVNENRNNPLIENEFLKWVYAGSPKRIYSNLQKRRMVEANLYFRPYVNYFKIGLATIGLFFFTFYSVVIS